MSSWLDRIFDDPRASAVAAGFGAVFEMMLASSDVGDNDVLLHYDEQWATTLPVSDVGRLDDLTDVLIADSSVEIHRMSQIEDRDAQADVGDRRLEPSDVTRSLRLLRAVYRFGLLAWILDSSFRDEGSRQRRQGAQLIAQHFYDVPTLTFVTGKSLEVSSDRRLAWWRLLMRPREGDRVVTVSFDPALIGTYLSVLMDVLPPEPPADVLDLPADPWLERYEPQLREGIHRAWPLHGESSFWDGPEGAAAAQHDEAIGRQRARVAAAIRSAVEDVKRSRAIRIRQGRVLPERRDTFVRHAQTSWSGHRTLGPMLRAFGAPPTEAEAPQLLLQTRVPKAAFVGEGAMFSVENYGEQVGRLAAGAEAAAIVRLLPGVSEAASPDSIAASRSAGLVERVIATIRALRQAGYAPSFVLTPNAYPAWSPLAVDTTDHEADQKHLREIGVPEYLVRFLRGRIEGVVVLSAPTIPLAEIVVLDASKAVAAPPGFDPNGQELSVELTERGAAEVMAELSTSQPDLRPEVLEALANERLEELDVAACAALGYTLVDPNALAVVSVEEP